MEEEYRRIIDWCINTYDSAKGVFIYKDECISYWHQPLNRYFTCKANQFSSKDLRYLKNLLDAIGIQLFIE